MRKSFRKYVQKAERLIAASIEVPENELKETSVILDFDGFSINQLLSLPSKKLFQLSILQSIEKFMHSLPTNFHVFISAVTYALSIGRDHRESIEHGRITKIIIINGKLQRIFCVCTGSNLNQLNLWKFFS